MFVWSRSPFVCDLSVTSSSWGIMSWTFWCPFCSEAQTNRKWTKQGHHLTLWWYQTPRGMACGPFFLFLFQETFSSLKLGGRWISPFGLFKCCLRLGRQERQLVEVCAKSLIYSGICVKHHQTWAWLRTSFKKHGPNTFAVEWLVQYVRFGKNWSVLGFRFFSCVVQSCWRSHVTLVFCYPSQLFH